MLLNILVSFGKNDDYSYHELFIGQGWYFNDIKVILFFNLYYFITQIMSLYMCFEIGPNFKKP